MNTPKHTPTPWVVGGPYPSVSVCVCTNSGSSYPEPEPPTFEPVAILDTRIQGEQNQQALANAAHIVRCVNGFDGLVEALKLAQATIDRLTVKHPGGFSSTQGSLDVIAAALKAVDEG